MFTPSSYCGMKPFTGTRRRTVGTLAASRFLFVSDLDGTLLNWQRQLPEPARRDLVALLQRGLPFTVVSARSMATIRRILAGLPISLPVIELNGAFISEFATGRHLISHPMERTVVEELLDLIQGSGLSPFIVTFDGQSDHLYHGELVNEAMVRFHGERVSQNDKRLQPLNGLDECLEQEVVVISVIAAFEPIQRLFEQVRQRFAFQVQALMTENLYHPGWYWLTITHACATREHALEVLARVQNVALEDVTVFGDEVSDIPMFEMAGHRVAVANAATPLKQIAGEIADANESGGVVEYLKRVWVTD